MARKPELSKKDSNDALTPTEENSEVNQFPGSAIYSDLSHFDKSTEEWKILQSIYCRLDDLDDEYLDKYNDRNMSMMNTDGMTLVSKAFFPWGKQVVQMARVSFTEETIHSNLRHGFVTGKSAVVNKRGLI